MIDLQSLLDRFKLTPEQFAERANLSYDRVSELLSGEDASLAELRSIASAFKITLSDLISPSDKYQRINLMFRRDIPKERLVDEISIDRLTKKIENSIEILGTEGDRLLWKDYFVVHEESYVVAERCAERFREIFFGGDTVSPLLKLPEIVVRDLEVVLFVVQQTYIDGASACIDGQPFVFVSSRFPPRMLFTLAHEVGHLISHKGDPGGFATLDWPSEDNDSSQNGKSAEAFANTFASCLLLPAAGVGVTLKKIRELAKIEQDQIGDIELIFLSRIFGTSFQVAARRCEDLKVLPRGGAHALYEKIRKEYGSPEKRAQDLKLPPRPEIDFPIVPERLLISAIERIKSGAISIGKASAILGISISDIVSAHARVQH